MRSNETFKNIHPESAVGTVVSKTTTLAKLASVKTKSDTSVLMVALQQQNATFQKRTAVLDACIRFEFKGFFMVNTFPSYAKQNLLKKSTKYSS